MKNSLIDERHIIIKIILPIVAAPLQFFHHIKVHLHLFQSHV